MTDPIRIQLSRAKGWKMPPNTVRVSRPSRWGNPLKIGDDISCWTPDCTSATAADAVDMHARLMYAHQAADGEKFEAFLAPLRGKNLACWCKIGSPCHADILLKLANEGAIA